MSNDIQKKFANRLKFLRQKRNLSQEDLALLCGIDRTYIGRIERLERKPTIVILDKIAKPKQQIHTFQILDISIMYLHSY